MMANVTLIAKLLPMFIILIAAIAVGSHMPDLNPVPTDAEGRNHGLWRQHQHRVLRSAVIAVGL